MKRGILGGLLGTAAGLALAGGAQAADLPVKAKPVEYVKICSAYGAGFYYIPGTDICLRVGGYVFVETGVKGRNAAVDIISALGQQRSTDLTTTTPVARTRSRHPRRTQQHGLRHAARLLRGRRQLRNDGLRTGQSAVRCRTSASMDRAFIQFAGLHGGLHRIVLQLRRCLLDRRPRLAGVGLAPAHRLHGAARQRRLGHALGRRRSSHRRCNILASCRGFGGRPASGSAPVGLRRSNLSPDIVANVRVDQAWGSAQIMGALHEVRSCRLEFADPAALRQVGLRVRWRFRNQDAADG